jgi:hypothetical protein
MDPPHTLRYVDFGHFFPRDGESDLSTSTGKPLYDLLDA